MQDRRVVPMTIEELVTKFVMLAIKPTLSKAEHEEGRKLMRQLKKEGMSNEEISELSKGKWSESTVKGYTKGVKASDPSPWQDVVALLNDLISTGIDLEDVDTAVTVVKDLKSRGVSLDNIVDLLLTADSAQITLDALVHQFEELHDAGLSTKAVSDALGLKKQMEDNSLSLDCLPALVKLAQAYGEPQKTIEAFSTYGSLSEMENEIEVSQDKLGELKANVDSLSQKSQQVEASLLELEKPLKAYQKISTMGFDEEELSNLANLAEKYGGPKAVLQALKLYTNYPEIKEKVEKAKAELGGLKAETGMLNDEYSHLKSAVAMCDSLLHKHKFGLDAIATILSIAGKYGKPLVVLKCIEAYGELQTVQQELGKLEGEATLRKQLLTQLEGKVKEAMSQMESLNAMAMKAGAEVAKVESRLDESKHLHKVMALIDDPVSASYQEYGPLVVAIVKAILKWVSTNEKHFLYPHSMKSTLQNLLTELGGE